MKTDLASVLKALQAANPLLYSYEPAYGKVLLGPDWEACQHCKQSCTGSYNGLLKCIRCIGTHKTMSTSGPSSGGWKVPARRTIPEPRQLYQTYES